MTKDREVKPGISGKAKQDSEQAFAGGTAAAEKTKHLAGIDAEIGSTNTEGQTQGPDRSEASDLAHRHGRGFGSGRKRGFGSGRKKGFGSGKRAVGFATDDEKSGPDFTPPFPT